MHGLYAIELGVAVTPVVLGGIESLNVRTETEHIAEPTSGDIYPRHIAIVAQKPSADFTSYALAQCLGSIGLTGLSIATLTNGGLNLYAQKQEDGGGRTAGAAHREYKMTKGIILPNRITCDHRGDALIAYDVRPTFDGTNDPFAVTDAHALPTAPLDAERFTLGKVTIGSVAITKKRSLELDFGITAPTEGTDSDIFDTHVSIQDIRPVLTLRGVDLEWLKAANIPLAGKAATHATTSVYLRKRLQTSAGFVLDATAQHIKLTMAGLCWIEDVFSAGGRGPTECSLKLAAVFDGTNAPVVINTASAIT